MSEHANEEQVNESGATAATEERHFTQADVDAIVQKRIARYADYDDVKAQLSQLQEEKDNGDWRNSVANDTRSEVLEEVNKRLLGAEALAQATAANFLYPEDAERLINSDAIQFGEDGYVDAASVKAEIERLKDERPALVRSETKTTAAAVGLGTGGQNKPLNAREAFIHAVS